MQVHNELSRRTPTTFLKYFWFPTRSVHLSYFFFRCVYVRECAWCVGQRFFIFHPPILHWNGSGKGATYLIITWKAFACILGYIQPFFLFPGAP